MDNMDGFGHVHWPEFCTRLLAHVAEAAVQSIASISVMLLWTLRHARKLPRFWFDAVFVDAVADLARQR